MTGRRLASLSLLLLLALPRAWSAGSLRLEVLPGWNGLIRADRSFPLTVSADNPGRRLACTVSVEVERPGVPGASPRLTVLSQAVTLPARSVRRIPFVIPAVSSARPLTVRVLAEGREAARVRVDLAGSLTSDAIVVAVSSELSLDFLAGLAAGVRVVYPHVEDIPENWAGYDGVDLVVVHDLASQGLRPRQASALARWVFAGGTLVVSGGPPALRLPGSGLEPLLPVRVTGLAEAPGLPGLLLPGSRSTPTASIALTRSSPAGGEVLAEQRGIPLVAVRRVGRGASWFLAFDWTRIPGWQGNGALWRMFSGEGLRPAVLAGSPLEDPWLSPRFGPPGFSFPRPAAALIFLGALLAALLPILGPWTARYLKPLPRALLSLGVAAAAAVAGFLLFGRVVFPTDALIADASTAEAVSGGDMMIVTERVGVLSAEPRLLDLRVAGGDVAVEESRGRPSAAKSAGLPSSAAPAASAPAASGPASAAGLEVVFGEDTLLSRVALPRFGARLFSLRAVRDMDVSVRVAAMAGAPALTVSNSSPFTLRDSLLSYEGRLYTVGDLLPGAREERRLAGTTEGPSDPLRLAFWQATAGPRKGGKPVLYAWLEPSPLVVSVPPGARRAGGATTHLLSVEAR